MSGNFPSKRQSLTRLRHAGWAARQLAVIRSSGDKVYHVITAIGEHQIHAEGSTDREAWHHAVEAAAADGMLAGWPSGSPDGTR